MDGYPKPQNDRADWSQQLELFLYQFLTSSMLSSQTRLIRPNGKPQMMHICRWWLMALFVVLRIWVLQKSSGLLNFLLRFMIALLCCPGCTQTPAFSVECCFGKQRKKTVWKEIGCQVLDMNLFDYIFFNWWTLRCLEENVSIEQTEPMGDLNVIERTMSNERTSCPSRS